MVTSTGSSIRMPAAERGETPNVNDLAVLDVIIALCLLGSLARPFWKTLNGVSGVAALPIVGFGIALAAGAAYGWRPETIPLTAIAALLSLVALPRLSDVFRRLRTDDYRERPIVPAAVGAVLCLAAAVFAVANAPRASNPLPADSAVVSQREISDPGRDVELTVRFYRPRGSEAAVKLAVVGPPLYGSMNAVDDYCLALALRGYQTVSFARAGWDYPYIDSAGGRRYPSAARQAALAVAYLFGDRVEFAARIGAAAGRERRYDLEYVLRTLEAGGFDAEFAFSAITGAKLIVGYGTSAAAVLEYASSPGSPAWQSVAAVESWPAAFPAAAIPASRSVADTADELASAQGLAGWAARTLAAFRLWTAEIGWCGIVSEFPTAVPVIPTLFISSDRISDLRYRDGRYAPTLQRFAAAKGPALSASFSGVGGFGFTSIPASDPFVAGLEPTIGRRRTDAPRLPLQLAGLLDDFAVEALKPPSERRPYAAWPAYVSADAEAQPGTYWNSTEAAGILRP
jgi:hypothetical protein